jgi:pyruvate formate lyase activating enzyme
MLKELLAENLVDYLAMDIKADEANYDRVSGSKNNFTKVSESIKLIMGSSIAYEFRTTCVPGFLDKAMMEKMGEMIAGADKW